MKILLDENMPESAIIPLRKLGHKVESINTLKLKGLDNGTLYREISLNYDICFTRDTGFVETVKKIKFSSPCKVLKVIIPQQPKGKFTEKFLKAFQDTKWENYQNGDEWPENEKTKPF